MSAFPPGFGMKSWVRSEDVFSVLLGLVNIPPELRGTSRPIGHRSGCHVSTISDREGTALLPVAGTRHWPKRNNTDGIPGPERSGHVGADPEDQASSDPPRSAVIATPEDEGLAVVGIRIRQPPEGCGDRLGQDVRTKMASFPFLETFVSLRCCPPHRHEVRGSHSGSSSFSAGGVVLIIGSA